MNETSAWVMFALIAGVTVMAGMSLIMAVIALILRDRGVRQERRKEDRFRSWSADLLLILDGDLEAQVLIAKIRPSERRLFLEFLLRYQRFIKGEEAEIIRALGRVFAPIVRDDLASGDETKRALAIQILGTFSLDAYWEEVTTALGDPSELVLALAAHTLVAFGDIRANEVVLQNLARFERWDRRHIASFLHRSGPTIIPYLLRLLQDPGAEIHSRIAASETLRYLAAPTAADVAASVLAETTNKELLCSCLRVLGEVGHSKHEGIVRSFCDSPSEPVRINAITAWSRLTVGSSQELLVDALGDPSNWVAMRAANALRRNGDRPALRSIARSRHERAQLAKAMLSP